MNIKAIFPPGVTELTVNGLHQWDYGRKLEIQADDLPAIVEVHFACAGMTEAVVRSCAVINGVATAVIPDKCLEQTTPILAWVYEIGGSTGITTKTLRLNIVARTKPNPGASIPIVVSNRYTECVSAVNDKVAALDGEVAAQVAAAKSDLAARQEQFTEGYDSRLAELHLLLNTKLPERAFWAEYTTYNEGDRLEPGVYMFKEGDPRDDGSDSVFLLDTKGGCSALVMYYRPALIYGRLARYRLVEGDDGKFSVYRDVYAPSSERHPDAAEDRTYHPYWIATIEEAGGIFYRPIMLY